MGSDHSRESESQASQQSNVAERDAAASHGLESSRSIPDAEPQGPESSRPTPDAAAAQGPESPRPERPEPDAICFPLMSGVGPDFLALALGKPLFEEWIGDVGPFLRLRRELGSSSGGLDDLGCRGPWIIVENIASFPVCLKPEVICGRLMQGSQDMPTQLLEPGETYKLTRFSTDEEAYRMECYASRIPHLVCNGISKRVDPTQIRLLCQPAARDSEGWYFMSGKDGIGRPEVWLVYIDAVRVCDENLPFPLIHAFLEYRLIQTCTFLDDRRPATRIFVPLGEIRFCQDSCGQTFRDGRELKSTVEELKNGRLTVAKLGIRVVALGSVHFAMDNRRLKCVKLAFTPTESIPVLLVDLSDPVIKEEWESKFTAGKRISTHEEARRLDLGPKGPNTDSGKGKGKQAGGKGKARKKRGSRQ